MNEGYAERAQANPRANADSKPMSAAEMRKICTRYLPVYKARHGTGHPQVVKLGDYCRRAGY